MNLLYFTTQQHALYHDINHRLSVVRGPAGSGKTILMFLQILRILSDVVMNKFKVLLLTNWPHTLRCRNFFRGNGISVREGETVPESFSRVSEQVVIVQLDKFTKSIDQWQSFIKDPHSPLCHLFIDDSQAVGGKDAGNLRKFISMHYRRALNLPNIYCWIAIL